MVTGQDHLLISTRLVGDGSVRLTVNRFIKQYSPTCHYCQKIAPAWQTLYEFYYVSICSRIGGLRLLLTPGRRLILYRRLLPSPLTPNR